MKIIQNSRGYTLVEIVAALAIITIVLISFSQFFTQSNKTAAKNNEKLVTINLADAALAKIQSKTYIKNLTSSNIVENFKNETKDTKFEMNGKEYKISYELSQNSTKLTSSNYSEKDLNLIKVVVTVTAPDNKTKASTEGYIQYEE